MAINRLAYRRVRGASESQGGAQGFAVNSDWLELLDAAKAALEEMCHTTAPRTSFTDSVDRLDAAITRCENYTVAKFR